MRCRPRTAVLSCALVVAVSRAGLAEDAPPPPPSVPVEGPLAPGVTGEQGEEDAEDEDPDVHRSYLHFQAGMELVERELWEAAVAEFEESLRLHHNSSALLNRALCLQRLLRYQEAIGAFQEYLDRHAGEASPERIAQITQTIEDIRSLVTEVHLDVSPRGATIFVRGRTVGTSPLAGPLLLYSGEHGLEVRMEGYQSYQEDIMVVRGRPLHLGIQLSLVPDTGLLRVATDPDGTRIAIDDQDVGDPPYEGRLRPGVHIVTANAPGYRTEDVIVTVTEGSEQDVTVRLHRNRLTREWFWSALGLSAAGVVATAVLGIVALGYDASYDRSDRDDLALYTEGHQIMLATDVSLGITGGLALTTFIFGLLTDWQTPRPNAE
jgi:hypothetical protein